MNDSTSHTKTHSAHTARTAHSASEHLGPERPHSLGAFFWALTGLALQGFGGVITVAQRVVVEQRRWLTAKQFTEAWAVAQVMPGPNIVNLCASLGLQYFGTRGVFVAVAGLLTIPFALTLALTALYGQFAHVAWVSGAVRGMAAVAAGLIIASGLRLAKSLSGHILGTATVTVFALVGFVLVGVLRWNLTYVLLWLGSIAGLMTWLKLRAQHDEKVAGKGAHDD
jgi:chromate transporter